MNTIEQAAKRLAELKRAGFDVPAPEIPGAAAASPVSAEVPAAAPVEAPAPAAAVAEMKASPVKSVASRASSAVVAAARHGVVEALTSSGRRSREVTLDLARLEREGYLVPAQARSQLAEQMRIIKRPLIKRAFGARKPGDKPGNLIMVTSALPGEGKTFTAINLAMSMLSNTLSYLRLLALGLVTGALALAVNLVAQQIGALFIIVFGLLLLASIVAFVLSIREHADDAAGDLRRKELKSLDGVIRTSWLMMFVFWVGWVAGDWVALTLFGLVSFFALREFLTLSPTRRGDHRSLVLAFFVVLPLQYWLVWAEHFDMFAVFIPVYVFLALPLASALANDPLRFLERNAKLQWGIMVCIYGMSHVPALLMLDFPGYDNKNAFMVFFLVLVVQTCMLVEHLVARRLNQPVAPDISASFHWSSWGIGMVTASVFGAALAGITPWVPGTAFAFAFIACLAGSLGHFVMKALKRDRGIPSWGGPVRSVTGAGGLLDRVDALCFAAPVFFHSARWYFDL